MSGLPLGPNLALSSNASTAATPACDKLRPSPPQTDGDAGNAVQPTKAQDNNPGAPSISQHADDCISRA
jgi:hypothetical protein